MIIGSVCENKASEKRISVTPENVKKFVSNGFKVYLEKVMEPILILMTKVFQKMVLSFLVIKKKL